MGLTNSLTTSHAQVLTKVLERLPESSLGRLQRDSAPLHSYLLLDKCILLVPLQKLGAGLKDQVSTHRKEINFFND